MACILVGSASGLFVYTSIVYTSKALVTQTEAQNEATEPAPIRIQCAAGIDGPRVVEPVLDDPPQASSTIRGQVIGEDGKPSASLRFVLRRLDQRRAGEPSTGRKPAIPGAGAPDNQLIERLGVTDLQGRFEVTGLARGRFELQAFAPKNFQELIDPRAGTPIRWTDPFVQTDWPSQRLTLQRPHLVVLFNDAKGDPWKGKFHPDMVNPNVEHILQDIPSRRTSKRLVPLVLPRDPKTGLAMAMRKRLAGYPAGSGCFVFELEEGVDYYVGGLGAGHSGRLQQITASPGSGRQDLTVTAITPEQFGSLQVTGKNLRPPGIDMGGTCLQASLEQIETGLRIQTKRIYPNQSSVSFTAPGGFYEVVLEETDFPSCMVPRLRVRALRSSRAIAQVQGKQMRSIELEL